MGIMTKFAKKSEQFFNATSFSMRHSTNVPDAYENRNKKEI